MEKGNETSRLNVRIFKNKWFARFARQNHITDKDLCAAIERAERGLIDADLGGSVIKQRIPRLGEGRSGGYRTLICFRVEERAFFVFGFAKSDLDNISESEKKGFKDLATEYLGLSDEGLELAVENEKFTEVNCDEQDV